MLKIHVFKKENGVLVHSFKIKDIDGAIEKMKYVYGENYSDKYEIEIDKI